jgi:hypothetical protein
MERVMDKKGQQLTLGTIILIVLGIAVLVFLIFGFSTGWGNLWDKITQYTGGSDNLGVVKQACAIACSTNSQPDFCKTRAVVENGKKLSEDNCFKLAATGVDKVADCPGMTC